MADMTVDGGVAFGLPLCFMTCSVKNQIGSEFRVSVRVHSELGCTVSYGNTFRKQLFFNEIMVTITLQF